MKNFPERNFIHLHRGWFITILLSIAVSAFLSRQKARYISNDYLIQLTKNHEIEEIVITRDYSAFKNKYFAEVILTAQAEKKYIDKLSNISPHFLVEVGSSQEDVNKWRDKLFYSKSIRFSFKKKYT